MYNALCFKQEKSNGVHEKGWPDTPPAATGNDDTKFIPSEKRHCYPETPIIILRIVGAVPVCHKPLSWRLILSLQDVRERFGIFGPNNYD